MASQILGKVSEKMQATTGGSNKKLTQLSENTLDVHDKGWRITSDFGVKQTNTDAWLSVATDDKKGPQLLEDQFGREKVQPQAFICFTGIIC